MHLKPRTHTPSSAGRQRGMSLVELMVGIAIGLVVVAAASLLTVSQLSENRRLMTEMQVQQDLRAAADAVTRELRRAGQLLDDRTSRAVWTPDTPRSAVNPTGEAYFPSSGATSAPQYSAEFNMSVNPSPFKATSKISLVGGVLRVMQPNGTEQELTDSAATVIKTFSVTTTVLSNEPVACPQTCDAAGSTECWPRVLTRMVNFTITAEAKSDPAIQRSIQGAVRVRNDHLPFQEDFPNSVCPL